MVDDYETFILENSTCSLGCLVQKSNVNQISYPIYTGMAQNAISVWLIYFIQILTCLHAKTPLYLLCTCTIPLTCGDHIHADDSCDNSSCLEYRYVAVDLPRTSSCLSQSHLRSYWKLSFSNHWEMRCVHEVCTLSLCKGRVSMIHFFIPSAKSGWQALPCYPSFWSHINMPSSDA